jgi:thiamine pyrophosphokinase
VKSASIFLNGSYPEEFLAFYRHAVESAKGRRLLIAADGGLELFARLGLEPELIVGDLDSVTANSLASFSHVETVRFPREKDATDGELALRLAIERGCTDIDVYGAIDTRFETDQMLANLFLLKLAKSLSVSAAERIMVRAVDHRQHIYFIEDEQLALDGKVDDFISVIPITASIVVSIRGVLWELDRKEVKFGSSLTLRNQFSTTTATITLVGAALVVYRHSP